VQIGKLLEKADAASKQAPSLLEFGRPDYAYVEYLVATHIVANLIPRHKDAPSLQIGHDRLHKLNREIIKVCNFCPRIMLVELTTKARGWPQNKPSSMI